MIDAHNFRFQSSDGGVSTSTTGSRSSAPSCPRPMTREYEFLFFHHRRCLLLLLLLLTLPLLLLLLAPLPQRSLILHLILCAFPTDHYFLFVTLYDELVQVRCSRREAFTGSSFFLSPLPRFLLTCRARVSRPPLSLSLSRLSTAARSSFLRPGFVSRIFLSPKCNISSPGSAMRFDRA